MTVERIATTLLERAPIEHPIVRLWVEQIIEHPDYTVYLSQFEQQPLEDWLKILRPSPEDEIAGYDERGYHVHTIEDVQKLLDEWEAAGFAPQVYSNTLKMQGLPTAEYRPWELLEHQAICYLATAVVRHRIENTPERLAEEVLEYVQTMANASVRAERDTRRRYEAAIRKHLPLQQANQIIREAKGN